jgi:hypothetical protein
MTRKLYVGGLPFETTDAELRAWFEQAGKVDSAIVITDDVSGLSRGFGCVEMSTKSGARRAISELNGKVLGEVYLSTTPIGPHLPAVAASMGEAVIPDAIPACPHGAHHWAIDRPDGPISSGICKWCSARRDFANSQDKLAAKPKPFHPRY